MTRAKKMKPMECKRREETEKDSLLKNKENNSTYMRRGTIFADVELLPSERVKKTIPSIYSVVGLDNQCHPNQAKNFSDLDRS